MEITKLTRPARKLLKLKPCGAVIVAAGNASRMGGVDKIMADLGGKTVIRRTAESFQDCDAVKEIVVVTREDLIIPIGDLLHDLPKLRAVVAGGKTRQESVSLGLNALSEKTKLAAIHDGARPLVTWQLIDRVVRAANTYGAAAPAVPVKDTVVTSKSRVVLRVLRMPVSFVKETAPFFIIVPHGVPDGRYSAPPRLSCQFSSSTTPRISLFIMVFSLGAAVTQ